MSVYRQQITSMTQLGIIAECLREMPQPKSGIVRGPRQGNFEPVFYPTKTHLIGFEGKERPEMAQLIIPRQQASSNDVGFEQEAPGRPVQIHISNADQQMHFNAAWVADLKVRYVEKHGRKIASEAGYRQIKRSQLSNGKVRLQFVRA